MIRTMSKQPESGKDRQYRVSITLPLEMRDRVARVAAFMGCGETQAARYLLMCGLGQQVGAMSAKASSDALEDMVHLMENESLKNDKKRATKKPEAIVRNLVTPGQKDKNVLFGGKKGHD